MTNEERSDPMQDSDNISGSSRREFLRKIGLTMGMLISGALDSCADTGSQNKDTNSIGATLIPYYTGNLSVTPFMIYWGTAKESALPKIEVDAELISTLHKISVFADVDYLAWCLSEQTKGVWDFSYYIENAKRLKQAGIQYVVFCWVHFPPKWMEEGKDFTPYMRLGDEVSTRQLSPWDPKFEEIYDRYYAKLRKYLGDRIDFLRVGYPSEYGEIGYPNGMTNWLVPQKNYGLGFWCGDPHAQAAYRKTFLQRYGTLHTLNQTWGTNFGNEAEIVPPDVTEYSTAILGGDASNVQARSYWLDFINWYQDSVGDCFRTLSSIIRHHFPNKKLVGSLGYGSERCYYGNDTSRHVKMLKDVRACAQTPGAIGYFATRRVSSACSFYHTPYYTEPPGDVDPLDEVKRIWMDAGNGCQVYFDYPNNMKQAIPEFREYKQHLNGNRSLTDFAYFFPSNSFWLEVTNDWPQRTYEIAEYLRNRLDYEVIDEQMIQDGALHKMGIRTLAWVEGNFAAEGTLDAIHKWVESGGTLIRRKQGPIYDLMGVEAEWLANLSMGDCSKDLQQVWKDSYHKIGSGSVILLEVKDTDIAHLVRCIVEFSVNHSLYAGADSHNTINLNPIGVPGVFSTLFKDRILIYNDSRTDSVAYSVTLRREDFLKRNLPLPEKLNSTFTLPPRTIKTLWLKR